MIAELLSVRTRKAQVSALLSALAAVLAATVPFLDGFWSNAALVVLTVLGSYGVTYAVPNTTKGETNNERYTDR